jgi:dipeptide/tripeptide permease
MDHSTVLPLDNDINEDSNGVNNNDQLLVPQNIHSIQSIQRPVRTTTNEERHNTLYENKSDIHYTNIPISTADVDDGDDRFHHNDIPSSSSTSPTSSSILQSTASMRTISISSFFIHHPIILYILITETVERFVYYGFRAILVFYLMKELQYTETIAIALYGYNSSLSYFTPIIGAYIADRYIGRYYTILYFSILYICGLLILTIATTVQILIYKRILSFIGLLLICCGTGGIKPCVSSFGADQLSLSTSTGTSSTNQAGVIHVEDEVLQAKTTTRNGMNNRYDAVPIIDPNQGHSQEQVKQEQEQESVVQLSLLLENEYIRVYFNYFYFCINIGAITSIAIIPIIRQYIGFTFAFGITMCCMIMALLIFYSKRNSYIVHTNNNSNDSSNDTGSDDNTANIVTIFQMSYQLFVQQIKVLPQNWITKICYHRNYYHRRKSHDSVDGIYRVNDDEEEQDGDDDDYNDDDPIRNDMNYNNVNRNNHQRQQMDDAKQLLHILPILAMFPIYSCLYDQQGSVWTIQATRMYIPYSNIFQPEQMNMINPLLIMVFIPLSNQIIYPWMQNKYNISMEPLRLMLWGMLLTAFAFFASGIVESVIDYHDKNNHVKTVNVLWQLPQIVLLAIGEIFLSVTGLEFAYAQSPIRLKAFVTALYLSTTGIGDLLAGVLYSTIFSSMKRSTVMHVCAIMMLCNMVVFVWVAKWYKSRTTNSKRNVRLSQVDDGVELSHI